MASIELIPTTEQKVADYILRTDEEYNAYGTSIPMSSWILTKDGFFGAPDRTKIGTDQIGFGEDAKAVGIVRCLGVVLDNGIVCHIGPLGNENSFTEDAQAFRKLKTERRAEKLYELSDDNLPTKILVANPRLKTSASQFHRAMINSLRTFFPDTEIIELEASEIGLADLST